ncbi:MAG: hypothetical protein FWB85_01190 [Chitinispirillia bacterium]|nr:hypothetical protein [Chitinispirillia bacterium]MCL2241274.1 hypothetical protein [Chitinispirillia bacterium]
MGTEVQQENLVFESQEAWDAAVAAVDTRDPASEDQLERIRNATIGAKEEVQGGTADPQEAELPQEPVAAEQQPAAEPATEPAPTAAPFELTPEKMRELGLSYKNAEELLKGAAEKERYIELQKEKERKLREELDALRAQAAQPPARQTPVPQASAPPPAANNSTITVESARQALANAKTKIADHRANKPEGPYDVDAREAWHDKLAELMEEQAEANIQLIDLVSQTKGGVDAYHAQMDAQRRQQEEAAETQRLQQALVKERAEMDAIGNDPEFAEFKMSKPSADVRQEYERWGDDVAMLFYSRPAKNADEVNIALRELERRSPDLMAKCRERGVPPVPSQDVQRYLQLQDMLDYRDGYYIDPNTGRHEQHKRYDQASGQLVPAMLPDLKTAIQQHRLATGFYKDKANQDFQRGAQSYAAAMTKRDPSVTELNNPSTMGSSGAHGVEWAQGVIERINPEEAIRNARMGSPSMLEEMNRARAEVGYGPITVT